MSSLLDALITSYANQAVVLFTTQPKLEWPFLCNTTPPPKKKIDGKKWRDQTTYFVFSIKSWRHNSYQIVEFCFLEHPFIHLHSIQEKLCVTYNGLKYAEKATLIRAKNVYLKKTWWLNEDWRHDDCLTVLR